VGVPNGYSLKKYGFKSVKQTGPWVLALRITLKASEQLYKFIIHGRKSLQLQLSSSTIFYN